jgi:hypothetical protein
MPSKLDKNRALCLMCGGGKIGADNCEACTWPYSIDGWKNFRLGLRRISIDKCCVNAKQQDDSLNKLEEWAREGKIAVQKATAFLKEPESSPSRLKKGQQIDDHPPLTTLGSSLNEGPVLGGPDLVDDIRSILFPGVKVKDLQEKQKQDIQHLREHVRTGGHVFVTIDKHFIGAGKPDALRRLGVWVCAPREAVELVKRVCGFS